MSGKSEIEWTDSTWNPVVGCKAVSPGCDHCYAAREASGRLKGIPVYAGLAADGVFTGEVRCLPERLDQPLHWRKPRRIFVNSMSDLFHPAVPERFISSVFDVMGDANWHTYQILTKRPQRMAADLKVWHSRWDEADSTDAMNGWFPEPHVWLGTSIESDRWTWRADYLRKTPAVVRFLSLEPLIGPLPSLDLTDIDWVIVGGESGKGARPMHPGWVRDIRDRCVEAGIPFLFKQWGSWAPFMAQQLRWGNWRSSILPELAGSAFLLDIQGDDEIPWLEKEFPRDVEAMVRHRSKKAAGRTLDGRLWDEYPDMTNAGKLSAGMSQ
jgi:protein gp37